MDSVTSTEWLAKLKSAHPSLPYYEPGTVEIDTENLLGEGAVCAAYRAILPEYVAEACGVTVGDRVVCARVILDGFDSDLLRDLDVLKDVADLSVPLYGYTLHVAPVTGLHHLVLLSALCIHGTLEDVAKAASAPMAPLVKADVLLQVARGLCKLRRRGIVWRDLKGQNLLVTELVPGASTSTRVPVLPQPLHTLLDATTTKTAVTTTTTSSSSFSSTPPPPSSGSSPRTPNAPRTPSTPPFTLDFAPISRLTIAMSDWGTAVRLPKMGKRRMTMHGPGTAGYVAPETRCEKYDHQVDMWALCITAMTLCVPAHMIDERTVEEAVADLKLEEKLGSWQKHDTLMDRVVERFRPAAISTGCGALYNLMTCRAARACNPAQRWSADTATFVLERFLSTGGSASPRDIVITPARLVTASRFGLRTPRRRRARAASAVEAAEKLTQAMPPPLLRLHSSSSSSSSSSPPTTTIDSSSASPVSPASSLSSASFSTASTVGERQGSKVRRGRDKGVVVAKRKRRLVPSKQQQQNTAAPRKPLSAVHNKGKDAAGDSNKVTLRPKRARRAPARLDAALGVDDIGLGAYRMGGILEVLVEGEWLTSEVTRICGGGTIEVHFPLNNTYTILGPTAIERTRPIIHCM